MKKSQIFFFFFLLSSINLFSQWERVTNIPVPYNTNYYLEVFFLPDDPQYGWICGYNGIVIRTTDGGETWQGTKFSTSNGLGQLESISFLNKLIGYVSGEGKIFKSTDGGATFQDITDRRQVFYLWGNYFITPDIGVVVGGGCDSVQSFFRTTDGGISWSLTRTSIPNTGLTDVILFAPEGLGYATSSGKIWRTLDGGISWSPYAVSGAEDWQEDLCVKNKSFLVPFSEGCTGGNSDKGGMRMSTDDGVSWKEFKTSQPMFGTFLHDELRGWAVGWEMNVWYTRDGGNNWVLKNDGIPTGISLDDICFVNDTIGWLVGDGVYKTTLSALGISAVSDTKTGNIFSIYPNPVSDFLNLTFGINYATNLQINIYNELSISVFSRNTQNENIENYKIDTKNLPSGVYFCQIKADSYSETKKFIVFR
ncbi:MAG: YCF48-related protein [Bacteroidota bacterium]